MKGGEKNKNKMNNLWFFNININKDFHVVNVNYVFFLFSSLKTGVGISLPKHTYLSLQKN